VQPAVAQRELVAVVEDGGSPAVSTLPANVRKELRLQAGETINVLVKVWARSGLAVPVANGTFTLEIGQNPYGGPALVKKTGVPSPRFGPNAVLFSLVPADTLARLPGSGQYVYELWQTFPGSGGPSGTTAGEIDGGAKWDFGLTIPSPPPGWAGETPFPEGSPIVVPGGNVWSAYHDLVTGTVFPPNLLDPSPPAGTVVDDGTDQWLIVPPWPPATEVFSDTPRPPKVSICNNFGKIYGCSQTGVTAAAAPVRNVLIPASPFTVLGSVP
jgi:hypothetical protein